VGNELQRLLPRHFKVLELCLEGHSRKTIAQTVGLTEQAISLITNSPIFQDEIARRRDTRNKKDDEGRSVHLEKARGILEEASVSAAKTQVSLLSSDKEHIQLASAKDILDRTYKGQKIVGSDMPSIVISEGSIQVLNVAIQEASLAEDERAKLIDQ